MSRRALRKDHIAAALLVALGVFVVWMGLDYHVGTPAHMGPGFIPTALGSLMIAIGLAIGLTAGGAAAAQAQAAGPEAPIAPPPLHAPAHGFEWRGWLCILGGVVAFVVLGRYGGLVPASFASVLVAAMGDRDSSWRGSVLLAAALTAFGVLVFHYGLKLQLPLLQWGG